MESSGSVGRPRGAAWQLPVYEAALAVLLLTLAVVTAASELQPDLLTPTRSAPLYAAVATVAFLVAVTAAYFALGEFMLYGAASSLNVGLAFLVFAAGNLLLGLAPLLGGWNKDIQAIADAWSVVRLLGGLLLLVSALLLSKVVPHGRRPRVIAVGIVLACAIPLAVATWAYANAASLLADTVQQVVEIATSAALFGASIVYWRGFRRWRRTWYAWLALALLVASAAQIQYAIRPYAPGVAQPGDILRLVFYIGILLALISEWSRSYRNLRWQTRELEALHALLTAPVVHNVAAVIEHIVRVVGESLQGRARIVVPQREDLAGPDRLSNRLAQLEEDATMLGADGKRRVVVTFDAAPGGEIALGVPLDSADRRLGLLAVARDGAANPFTKQDVNLLQAFGAQASLLLERSLLYEDVAAGAVLEERSRLAREIHDGLAQHLAFLKMRVAWMQRSKGGMNAEQLGDIEGVLDTALVEARQAISTLRAEPDGTSAVEAIAGYAEEFSQVSGLPVDVETVGTDTDVGPKVRVELLRVVQEALNNVRKHARASQIWVRVAPRRAGLEVIIRDDGVGVDAGQDRDGHFGLQIMRERAESVGGRLELESSPGDGTAVRVWVPIRESESLAGIVSPARAAENQDLGGRPSSISSTATTASASPSNPAASTGL